MNNNAIKRIQLPALIWLAIVLMFLPSAVVFAAPKPEGYIVDDAGLFSSSEISAIEDRIAQAPFDLYVYTVEHLDGTTIDRLSADTSRHGPSHLTMPSLPSPMKKEKSTSNWRSTANWSGPCLLPQNIRERTAICGC